MDDKNIKFFEPSNPLILNKEIVSSSNINDEILKIKNLVKAKYLTTEKFLPAELKTSNDADFISIRTSAKKINNDIKEKILLINNSIENQKNEIKSLYFEKKLLDQNQVQSNIINNQQKLINNYKKNISSHNSLRSKQINEMTNKIKFYQEENIRLSSELNSLQNKYSTIKNNFTTMELEKNNIYKQIHELNNSLIKTNIIGTPFVKELIKEDSINSKVLNDITNNNLQEDKTGLETKKILDNEITDIFN